MLPNYQFSLYKLSICSKQSNHADIILTPYNYVLDKTATMTLQNKILIIDEGHHLERRLEDRNSFAITTGTLRKAYDELELCVTETAIAETTKELRRTGKRPTHLLQGTQHKNQ
jgi:Rad3-related DNA helicase